MGSIQGIDSIPVPDGQDLKQAQQSVIELVSEIDQSTFKPFKIDGLAAKSDSGLTGMRDELVLLSWCIVLLRTSEEGQASFEWAYRRQQDNPEDYTLNTAEVFSSLQRTVEQARNEILQRISTSSVDQSTSIPRPASLVLSTGLLAQTTSEVDDKVGE